MSDLRYQALDLAIRSKGDEAPDKVVKRADAFLTFLNSGVAAAAIVAPTPTASPLAEPNGTEPARLDDPKVVAAAEAVIEHPPVSGGDTASTTSSSAGAASASPAEQPTEVAPSAAPSTPSPTTPDVKDVNAAVLAFNRAKGREETVALLAKYGGTKVPEIDSAKWAELLAELKAGVA